MILRSHIEQVINSAETEYMDYWDFLAHMRDGKLLENDKISLTQFQSKLANTIFELTRLYRKVEQEKKRRIETKSRYSKIWFASRMRFLSDQQEIINKTIALGRGLGDAFACFFYDRDRHYLSEHLKQPAQIHAPPGVGGIGELEFIKNVASVCGYFVIYHGTTNVLRLGDITLIDPRTLRVAGIGELKSHSFESGKIEVALLISGPQLILETRQEGLGHSATLEANLNISRQLTPAGHERLKRQIKRISQSYTQLTDHPAKKLNVEITGHFKLLEELALGLRTGDFSYKQAGNSLLLVGYKGHAKSLYKKFSNSRKTSITRKIAGVENHALKLIDPNRNDNSLILGSMYYDSDGRTDHKLGMAHLVWWPVNSKTIKDIVFQDSIIFTIFNPVHFTALLEKSGFSVREIGELQYLASKKIGNHNLQLEGIGHYFSMISNYLMSDEAIISMLNEAESYISNLNANTSTRIQLLIEQRFGRPLPECSP